MCKSFYRILRCQWKFRLALVLLATLLSACAAPAPQPTAAQPADSQTATTADTAAPATGSARCGDGSKLSQTLHFYNWADYMDQAILDKFKEECGVEVVMDLYTSNEEHIAKLQAGNSGYDLVIPTDYAAKILIDNGFVAELDKRNIPNLKNLKAETMGLWYDPENKYTLPYQWSTTAIAYNAKFFDLAPDSWASLFDPEILCKNKGKVSMLDDQNEAVGGAMLYLGYKWNDTDPAHHAEAKELLLGQKECISGYNSANFIQALVSEEVVMAEAWGFAAAIARSENENIQYFIPKEGGIRWQDNFIIPKDAPHQYTAEVFINYMLEPDIGAMLTEFTFGFTPNKAAEEKLSETYYKIINEGGIAVDEEIMKRLDFSPHEGQELFADTFTAVKSQ